MRDQRAHDAKVELYFALNPATESEQKLIACEKDPEFLSETRETCKNSLPT
jgi:hypothetical protein